MSDAKIYDCEVKQSNGDVLQVRVSSGAFEWGNEDGPIFHYTEGKPLDMGMVIEFNEKSFVLSKVIGESDPYVEGDFDWDADAQEQASNFGQMRG